jgi:hypothetical protein
MEQSKGYLQSQTIIGAIQIIVPVLFLVLKIFGIEIPAGDQATFAENLANLVIAAIAIWGLINVVIGRIKATKPLAGVPFIKNSN